MSQETPRTRTIAVGAIARVEGEGALRVTVKDGTVQDVELKIFEPPRFFEAFLQGRHYDEVPDIVESAPPFTRTALTPGSRNRVITTDLGKGLTVVEVHDTGGRNRYDEIDLIAEARSPERYTVVDDDPLSATAEVGWTWEFERGNWRIRTESRTHVSCTKREFVIRGKLEAYEGDRRVFAREFEERVPRTGN